MSKSGHDHKSTQQTQNQKNAMSKRELDDGARRKKNLKPEDTPKDRPPE